MSQPLAKEISEDPLIQWVTFKLANEVYGLNVMQVQEVLRYSDIAPVPGAPSYVLGIINLRGNVVTVMDTRERFGLPKETVSDNSRILIVESEHHVIGMLVDSVAEVVYLRQSEIDVSPSIGNDESSKFIQGVCYKNEVLLILVDFAKMLSSADLMDIKIS